MLGLLAGPSPVVVLISTSNLSLGQLESVRTQTEKCRLCVAMLGLIFLKLIIYLREREREPTHVCEWREGLREREGIFKQTPC